MKKLSTAQQIDAIKEELKRDIARWNEIKLNGCNDPFWPDGVNLNLKRNHIIYDLRRLAELELQDVQLSFFMVAGEAPVDDVMSDSRIPPELPNDYMVRDTFENGMRVRA